MRKTVKPIIILFALISAFILFFRIKEDKSNSPEKQKNAYDDIEAIYTSYNGLVMTGYQGWFTAEGDGADRGWRHYQKGGRFKPESTSVDFWPDINDYSRVYKTEFKHSDGTPAYVYSPYDEESVDLHFKWMKEYGIDGAFMQRFIVEIKNPAGKNHFNKVLESALKAAAKYERAICIMYDLSGCTSSDLTVIANDLAELQAKFNLFNSRSNPTYLRHHKRPLIAIWGVGFNDGRKYSLSDVQQLIETLNQDRNKFSLMLGVPYYWRTLDNDTENNPFLHTLIKEADIIMPWAVGRYNSDTYREKSDAVLTGDIRWCKEHSIDYVPLVFPGFSWGNLKNDPAQYNSIPREKGEFFWKQVAGAKLSGAQSLYLAMFDEIDEGTALFKCLRESEVPLNGNRKFVGIEDDLESDYYLWLSGQAARWIKGKESYTEVKPERSTSNNN